MASLVLGAVGAGVGFLAGGPAGAQWGWAIGSMVGSSLTSLPDVNGPRLSDLKVQASTYGMMIPILYGSSRITGNVIWSTDLVETITTTSSGGKGMPSQDVNTASYSFSCAVVLCEGTITGVRRIWANGILIMDMSTSNTGVTGQNGNIRIYTGSETQMPSSLQEGHLGAGNVPAYRGLAYVEFEDFQLADYGNRPPVFSFEVVKDGAFTETYNVIDTSAYSTSLHEACIYNPLLDEVLWVGYSLDSSTCYLIRINPNTGAIIGVVDIGLPSSFMYENSFYEPIERQIWLNDSVGFYVYDATTPTYAHVKTIAGPILGTYITENAVDPSTGRIYLAAGNMGTPAIYNIDKTTGATLNSDTFPPNMWPQGGVAFDNSGVLWFNWNDDNLVYYISGWNSETYALETYAYPLSTVTNSNYNELANAVYDSERNSIWSCCHYGGNADQNVVIEFDIDTKTFAVAQLDVNVVEVYINGVVVIRGKIDGGVWFFGRDPITGNGAIFEVNRTTKELITCIISDTDPTMKFFPWNDFVVAHNSALLPMAGDGHGVKLSGQRLAVNTVTLSSIVQDLCVRADMITAELDVSQLTDQVTGYVVAQRMSARSAIESLQAAYYFDAVESD